MPREGVVDHPSHRRATLPSRCSSLSLFVSWERSLRRSSDRVAEYSFVLYPGARATLEEYRTLDPCHHEQSNHASIVGRLISKNNTSIHEECSGLKGDSVGMISKSDSSTRLACNAIVWRIADTRRWSLAGIDWTDDWSVLVVDRSVRHRDRWVTSNVAVRVAAQLWRDALDRSDHLNNSRDQQWDIRRNRSHSTATWTGRKVTSVWNRTVQSEGK